MCKRMNCCVPFCRRTRGQRKGEEPIREGEEWICGRHWSAVPSRLKNRKKAHARYVRRECRRQPLMREWWHLPPGSPERIKAIAMFGLSHTLWRRCVRAAIEAAGGIS